MAIPIAKSMGLYVITSGSEIGRLRTLSIGADQFINYKIERIMQAYTLISIM